MVLPLPSRRSPAGKSSGSRRAVSVAGGRAAAATEAPRLFLRPPAFPGHRPSSTAPTATAVAFSKQSQSNAGLPKEFFTAIAGPFPRFPQGSSVGIQTLPISSTQIAFTPPSVGFFIMLDIGKQFIRRFGRYGWEDRTFPAPVRMRCRAFGRAHRQHSRRHTFSVEPLALHRAFDRVAHRVPEVQHPPQPLLRRILLQRRSRLMRSEPSMHCVQSIVAQLLRSPRICSNNAPGRCVAAIFDALGQDPPTPAARSSVFSASGSIRPFSAADKTRRSTFFTPSMSTATLPPIEESTCDSSVVGIL